MFLLEAVRVYVYCALQAHNIIMPFHIASHHI